MKTWKEDNLLKKLKEAEGEYLSELVGLINGEAVAAIQYQFAANNIVGPDQSYLVGHFTEHSTDEWGHYNQLVAALMQRDGKANLNLGQIINNAIPATEELESADSEYLRDFFARAEENAIVAYQNYCNKIENTDKDLADIINTIISDERDHKLDFTRIVKNTPVVTEVQVEEPVAPEPVEPAL